ncbi:hypothetical protein VMCG_01470 [Cytospora schulzeri]|uniref:Uncharacterized protein n=1 Tax=Cytospora schulzeri TaxID=448051 RepID=A0A423X6Q5_9PEZI|nr:hypothetical protein VMCG_01470 [Valsa malicola]
MSSHATAQSRGNASPKKLSTTIYNLVMTPVIFVSFLTSLAWVEFRYSLRRSHSHSEEPSALPRWLHRIVYREAPYKYVKMSPTKAKAPAASDEGTRWYYHRKQRKLMKMEVDDAFQIRRTVLVVLGLLGVVASWALWWVVWWIWTTATA